MKSHLPAARDFAGPRPPERLLKPAEIARVLASLADADSGATTGAVVPVDGGLAL